MAIHIVLVYGASPVPPGNPPVLSVIGADARPLADVPFLVVVTHGWYERQAWPEALARAISEKTDDRTWCCGWYDWRSQAKRLLPQDAALVACDSVGPQLGRAIVQLSGNWKHVHLIGHSAGSWVINEAARIVARRTSASIHLTFLDAYVPGDRDETSLGDVACDPNLRCWVEHYFTRDPPLHLTENPLTHAYNVDITAVNPGFNGHKFPWHWYLATVRGRFTARGALGEATVWQNVNDLAFGMARSREAGEGHWQRSLQLAPATVALTPAVGGPLAP